MFIEQEGNKVQSYSITTKALAETAKHIWVGTSNAVFRFPEDSLLAFRFPIPTGFFYNDPVFERFKHRFAHLSGYRVLSISPDSLGNVWLGTNKGLVQFIEAKQRFVKHKRFTWLTKPISVVKSWKGGKVLIAFKNKGLGIFDGSKLLILDSKKHFSNGEIRNIKVVNGDIWLCTSRGLYSLKPAKLPNLFDVQRHQVRGNQLSEVVNDVLVESTRIVMLCEDGLSVVPTESGNQKTKIAPALFNVNVYRNQFRLEPEKEESFELKGEEIRLTWACLDFRFIDKLFFRFRLNPKESWQETRNFTKAFSNLGPGYYQPEVQVRDASSSWSSSVKMAGFQILPPFWKRWWFLLFVVMISSASATYLIQAIAKQRQLRNNLDRSLAEANLKALKAQIKPHFIFNAINSVQHFFLNNRQEDGLEYLSRFAQLIRKILEGSEKQFHSLNDEVKLLEDYLAIEEQRMGEGVTHSIAVEADLSQWKVQIPTMLIQPLVENALWHGLGKLDVKKGHVSIRFGLKAKEGQPVLQVEVEDNGVGLVQPSSSKHDSLGLKGIHQKLEMLNKRYQVMCRFSISFRNPNVHLPNQGTLAILQLPLQWPTS